ncbi:hypothetical protein IFM89_024474, partial [Coptis chinensis]
MIAMDDKTYKLIGPGYPVMVMDYKLTYPSGTATAMLINSFHTNSGAELAGLSHSEPNIANTFWRRSRRKVIAEQRTASS